MARHLKAQACHSTVIAILIISECISYAIPIKSKKIPSALRFPRVVLRLLHKGLMPRETTVILDECTFNNNPYVYLMNFLSITFYLLFSQVSVLLHRNKEYILKCGILKCGIFVYRETKSSVTKPLCTRNETGNKVKIQTKNNVIKNF